MSKILKEEAEKDFGEVKVNEWVVWWVSVDGSTSMPAAIGSYVTVSEANEAAQETMELLDVNGVPMKNMGYLSYELVVEEE